MATEPIGGAGSQRPGLGTGTPQGDTPRREADEQAGDAFSRALERGHEAGHDTPPSPEAGRTSCGGPFGGAFGGLFGSLPATAGTAPESPTTDTPAEEHLWPAVRELLVSDGGDGGRRAVRLGLDAAPYEGVSVTLWQEAGAWQVQLLCELPAPHARLLDQAQALADTLSARLRAPVDLALALDGPGADPAWQHFQAR